MATKTPDTPNRRVVSFRNKVTAARIRVNIDRQRGVETPEWIRELAQKKTA